MTAELDKSGGAWTAAPFSDAHLRQVFAQIDVDEDGRISPAELKSALCEVELPDVGDAMIQRMISWARAGSPQPARVTNTPLEKSLVSVNYALHMGLVTLLSGRGYDFAPLKLHEMGAPHTMDDATLWL